MKPRTACGFIVWTVFAAIVIASAEPQTARAQNIALVIANANYQAQSDLPGDLIDQLRKQNALANAGWTVIHKTDRTSDQIIQDIKDAKQQLQSGKFFFIWYSGHGRAGTGQDGALVGVNHNSPGEDVVTPPEFAAAVTDAGTGDVSNRTFVKLDSCGSGQFAVGVNGVLGADDIGFQTAVTGTDIAAAGCSGSPFSTCYVEGMNGAADAAPYGNGDDMVTTAEAAAYAEANCKACVENENAPPNTSCDAGECVGTVTCGGDCHCTDPYSNIQAQYQNLVIGKPKSAAGFCVLNLGEKGGVCVENISEAECVAKNGVWNLTTCIPTVSEWGLAVMAILVLTAATVVIMRRRAAATT